MTQKKLASFTTLFIFSLFSISLPNLSYANELMFSSAVEDDWGDDNWAEEDKSPWTISGFSELAYGQFLQSNVVRSDDSLAELRGRLEVNYSHPSFELTASGDAIYDDVLTSTSWQTREFNLSANPLDNLDIKLGRQVLTWGTGDYLFLNDLFAKDWQSFFSGRDDEYLKAASDSVRLTSYWHNVTLDMAWTPDFQPDRYLTGERFSFYSPQAKGNVAPAEHFYVEQTSKAQWSGRLATSIDGVEYALYGYKGFWTTPTGVNEQGHYYFPKLNAWGASVLSPLASGLVKLEFSIYNSLEDRQGNKAQIANSQVRLLLGYEQEAAKNLTLGLQYYLEKTENYQAFIQSNPNPKQAVSEYRQLATIRLRYSTLQQKLIYSLFAFYSPTDNDAYLKPSVHYRYDDHLSLTAGANLFMGNEQYTFFGQHQDNSNAWLRLRYSF